MTATVGVLCTRVRVEEKRVLAALAEAGARALPLPPAALPLPVGPVLPVPVVGAAAARVIVDRCRDRAVAGAVLAVCRGLGATVLDAGLAATGDRLAVAAAFAAAGLPRPETRLVCSAAAALAAIDDLGYPGTLLPLGPGTPATDLVDRDAAEAVTEHREVLGGAADALALVQAGAPAAGDRALVLVVDGRAIAVSGAGGPGLPVAALVLAEEVAAVLGALIVGVEIATTAAGFVVWDVLPVPDFRDMTPLGDLAPAAAIAAAAAARLDPAAVTETADVGGAATEGRDRRRRPIPTPVGAPRRQEVADGVALTA